MEKLLERTSCCVGVRGVRTSTTQPRPRQSLKKQSFTLRRPAALRPRLCARLCCTPTGSWIPKANEIKANSRSVAGTQVHNHGSGARFHGAAETQTAAVFRGNVTFITRKITATGRGATARDPAALVPFTHREHKANRQTPKEAAGGAVLVLRLKKHARF